MVDLDERGFPEPKPFAKIPGGLLGDAVMSDLFIVDGLVWEFAKFPNQQTRVYMYEVEDLQEHEKFRSHT